MNKAFKFDQNNNTINIVNYSNKWVKIIKKTTMILNSISLEEQSSIMLIQFKFKQFETELTVIVDKHSLNNAKITYFVYSNLGQDQKTFYPEETTLLKTKCSETECTFETKLNKQKLTEILQNEAFYIKTSCKDTTVIKFKTNQINALIKLKQQTNFTQLISAEKDLQENLQYNLKNKIKLYIAQINFNDELVDQYEKMEKRLINEINLPRLKARGLTFQKYIN